MKKLFVTMIALAVAATAFAQFPKGLSVGAGYSSTGKVYDIDVPQTGIENLTTSLGGFVVSANYNIPIGASGLGVAPGLWFQSNKGDMFEIDNSTQDVDWKEISLGVPVFVNYTIPVADVVKLVPYLGPTLEYNISAKLYSKDDDLNIYEEFDDGGRMKHVQLYLGGGVAFDIADIVRISVGYDYGLLNRIVIDEADEAGIDYKFKDSGRLHVGVAYLF